jgi:hypothetical protein
VSPLRGSMPPTGHWTIFSVERTDGIATLILTRPGKSNAPTFEAQAGSRDHFAEVRSVP